MSNYCGWIKEDAFVVGRFDLKVGAVNWTKLEPKQAATSEKTKNNNKKKNQEEGITRLLILIVLIHLRD